MTDERFELTRRKALAGLGAIGVAGAGAGLGTSALFSDEESFENNSIQAGELDLVVDYVTTVTQDGVSTGSTTNNGQIQGGVSGEYQIADVKPGDSGFLAFCPKIVDNKGWLFAGSAGGVTDYENGQTEPEEDVDSSGGGNLDNSTNDGSGAGELSEAIQVDVEYCEPTADDPQGPGDYDTVRSFNNPADYTLADLFKELESGFLLDGTPNTSGTQAYPSSPDQDTQNGPCVCVKWEVPASVGNEIQSDAVEFDITFAARQRRNNPNPENPIATTTVYPGDSIQSAIDGASGGDVISVFGGNFGDGSNYDEPLSISKPLTLARASAEMPVIDDTSSSNIETVSISTSDVVFDGLEVTGSPTSPSDPTDSQNAGIRVEAPSSSTISNVVICNTYVRDIQGGARATGIGTDADQGPIPSTGADGTINDIAVYNCRVENVYATANSGFGSAPSDGTSKAKGIASNGEVARLTIRQNTITSIGGSDTGKPRGITLAEDGDRSGDPGAKDFAVVGNQIDTPTGDADNPAIFVGGIGDTRNSRINGNNILGPVDYLASPTPIDVTQNWWGQSGGPQTISPGTTASTGALVNRGTGTYDASSPLSSSNADAGSSI